MIPGYIPRFVIWLGALAFEVVETWRLIRLARAVDHRAPPEPHDIDTLTRVITGYREDGTQISPLTFEPYDPSEPPLDAVEYGRRRYAACRTALERAVRAL